MSNLSRSVACLTGILLCATLTAGIDACAADKRLAYSDSLKEISSFPSHEGSFGIVELSESFVVDSGAGLVFKVSRKNGDITSIKYKGGPELQDQAKGSHIESGLGGAAAVTAVVSNGVAKVTLQTDTLTHYLIVRNGENSIYMGTYISAEPHEGEMRWITRLKGSSFPNVPPESNNAGTNENIESRDVKGHPDGTTTSKYYGNERAVDLSLRGVTGAGIGAFMVYGSRESSSGGPFYRDIQNQSGTDAEVYNYMNSGHAQTEPFRMGFHGPYALMFTDGAKPAIPDMRWMEALNLRGVVTASQRGSVVGKGLRGTDPSRRYTVAFENATAQYWTDTRSPGAHFTAQGMKPGTYKMTVYKEELALYSSIKVIAGGSTEVGLITLTTDPDKDPVLWRIGSWDGTPLEFLNGETINLRHPSDKRNLPWGPINYVVGSSFIHFPAAQWKDVNTPVTINFSLKEDQVINHKIRIGITTAYAGGRPEISVNKWKALTPSPSSQPESRSLTTGTYRGNNVTYTFDVPASAFVVGSNTLTISVASGSGTKGFLSAAFCYDALDML